MNILVSLGAPAQDLVYKTQLGRIHLARFEGSNQENKNTWFLIRLILKVVRFVEHV